MSTTKASTSDGENLVTENNVKKALRADKGTEAVLKSWKVVDFTKRGDNYATAVTSVEVKYSTSDKEDCEVSYVVKLNPHRKIGEIQEAQPFFFEKEGRFYEELVPALNEALKSAGQRPIGYAECYFVSLEEGKEQIYFEDLRAKGFRMFDRRRGLDKSHVSLVVSELARLHSASYLLTKNLLGDKPAASKFDFLSTDLLNFTPNARDIFLAWIQQSIDTGIMMLEVIGDYDTAVSWLKSFKSEVESVLSSGIKSTRFNSICHGDIWNNNMLFRYNNEGQPVEVMLLDLQLCREASIMSDLNYVLFTSVNGDVRKSNLEQFLSLYYSTYKNVIEAGALPMYFTREELEEEYRDKNKYGVLFAMVIVPLLLNEPEELPDLAETDFDSFMNDIKTLSMDKLKRNPLCKPRFLALFDELMATGLIS